MLQGALYQTVRLIVIATVAVTAIGILLGPSIGPVRTSERVPRFEDVMKRGDRQVARPSTSDESVWQQVFVRSLHAAAPPAPNVMRFGGRLVTIDRSLVHRSRSTSPVQAAPYIRAIERWSSDPCNQGKLSIAAANANAFVFDRREELRRSGDSTAGEPIRDDATSAVWQGREGERMRGAIVDLAIDGRLVLVDYGDAPLEEISSALEFVSEAPRTCSRDRRP
jgi:hypothetical protein